VLVTGGAGSVGRQFVDRLLESGRTVRVLDLPVMDFSGLEGRDNVQVVRGDITELEVVEESVSGVSAVVHLAALLPPNSERDRDKTFAVNVGGTETIVAMMEQTSPDATLVFPSSVSTYGDTAAEAPPVSTGHSLHAIDIYAESKIAAEASVRRSALKTVVMRIAGIAVPAFLEPPEVWPFTPDQRVEMVHRDDVVDALVAPVQVPEAAGKVLNISGGPTWQLTGRDYVKDFYDFLGAPAEDAVYRDEPGWMDWYDTTESQRLLGYQNRSYKHYAGQMRALVASMMAG
jgi:nucleoside-diphosphate-sugar epimerase